MRVRVKPFIIISNKSLRSSLAGFVLGKGDKKALWSTDDVLQVDCGSYTCCRVALCGRVLLSKPWQNSQPKFISDRVLVAKC